ncbi:ArgE/DapE family deacylase [Halomonas sp. TRM85114]|uniref:ArgE/DapE family deacylase n=1 Tax=Halomonas jincaotanensis TaxID=2810616 RepID=UPI001BD37511|nr:ArgE/DapE family deacylase [Halomonas jincaotanensis]MBS9402450.1 ArgE/DapE family deacylase [Halomonas jincaotanensis]
MLQDSERRVLAQCDEVFDQTLDMTRDLVREYSVLGQERGVLEVMEGWFERLGLPVERVPLDDPSLAQNPHHAPVNWPLENRYNLVSALNPEADGPHLVFNGHLDVVPAEPTDTWTRPPWEPWQQDGWLYGRGAGDMKAGIAAMVMAVHAVRQAGVETRLPLTLQTVIEEECSGNGALACIHRGHGGDFVLIPEPFGARIYSGQTGVVRFRIRVDGVPAHVLDTSAGSDAIETMQRLIPALKALEAELNAERRPPYDALAHPFNLNIGRFEGGNWASSVPAHAIIEGRIGFAPEASPASVMQRLVDAVQDAHARLDLPGAPPRVSFHGFRSEGHLVDLASPGVSLLEACHRELTGRDAEHYLSTCTTDLRAFHVAAGVTGTCYGPVAEHIHGIDERVDIESIRHTLKAYALFLCRWGITGSALHRQTSS